MSDTHKAISFTDDDGQVTVHIGGAFGNIVVADRAGCLTGAVVGRR
jgi:hypothetical protein